MFDWIVNNKTWLFSGIGVFIISYFIGWLLKSKKKSKNSIQTIISGSDNIQIDGDVSISVSNNNISDNFKEDEISLAKRVITYFENRRVLFSRYSEKCPGGVIDSIVGIRKTIHDYLEKLERNSFLFLRLSNIQEETINFLNFACKDCKEPQSCKDCTIYDKGCVNYIKEFRKRIGHEITMISKKYEIPVRAPLSEILPNKH
jgi:hypothetical protein